MKPVIDKNGAVIEGLFRNNDGSLTINNRAAFNKNKIQHDNFASLSREVQALQEQMKLILEKLNVS